MSFCKNCGKQLADDAAFCANCGTPVKEETTQQKAQDFAQEYPTNPQPATNEAADIQNNKFMAVLSYIGILVLIPLFAAKESKYAQFHARQGVTLAVFEIAYAIADGIITFILGLIFPIKYSVFGGYTYGAAYSAITAILGLGSIFFLVLAIIGIINAAQGTKKELPIIGKIDLIKTFLNK